MVFRNPSWRRRLVAVAVLVVSATAGGMVVAVARTTGTDTVISACLNRRLGVLSKVTISPATPRRCTDNTVRVSWNRRGPRGPRGPAGTSTAYDAVGVGAGVPLSDATHDYTTTVATITVPAGNHGATVTGVASSGLTPADWSCHLVVAGVSHGLVGFTVPAPSGSSPVRQTFAMTTVAKTDGTAVAFRCFRQNGPLDSNQADVAGAEAEIVLVRVDSLG